MSDYEILIVVFTVLAIVVGVLVECIKIAVLYQRHGYLLFKN